MVARLFKFPRPDVADEDQTIAREGRAEAGLTASEREFLPECLEILETPPSPYQRAVVWTVAAVVIGLLIWSSIGTLDVVSTAPGRFIPDGRVKVVQVTETAIVKAIHVSEGQQVKAGDLLMELDPTLADADLVGSNDSLTQSDLNAERIAAELQGGKAHYGIASENLVALQETLRLAREATYAGKVASANAQVEEKKAALDAAKATLNKQATLLSIAQEQETQNRALLDEQFISRSDYLNKHQGLVSAENDHAAQLGAVEQARQALVQAQNNLTLISTEHRSELLKELNANTSARPDLQAKLDRARKLHALKWLRAPVSGYVQAVAVTTTGGVVSPAQNLVTIVPENTPLIIEATLSNDDIGYVKVGQPVNIKVDTYPFQRYGTLAGTLTWVSPDADSREAANSIDPNKSAEELKTGSKASGLPPVYRVHIIPNQGEKIIVNHQPVNMKPGMSVQADIATDHRKIYEFFLAPVIKYLDDGVKVR